MGAANATAVLNTTAHCACVLYSEVKQWGVDLTLNFDSFCSKMRTLITRAKGNIFTNLKFL